MLRRSIASLVAIVAALSVATFATILGRKDCHGDSDERSAIYHAILDEHKNDAVWTDKHVVLKRTDGFRFVATQVADMQSKMSFVNRAKYWSEFHSFLNQRDGDAFSYSPKANQPIRLISSSERSAVESKGLVVLTFTLPGLNFWHDKAMVFMWREYAGRPGLAPSASGSLIYIRKVSGRWAIDHPSGLPSLYIVT